MKSKLLIIEKDPRFVTFLRKFCEDSEIDYYPKTDREEDFLHKVLIQSISTTRSVEQRTRSKECLDYIVGNFFGKDPQVKKICYGHCDIDFETTDISTISFCEAILTEEIFVVFVARLTKSHDRRILLRTSGYANKKRKSAFIDKGNPFNKKEIKDVIATFLED